MHNRLRLDGSIDDIHQIETCLDTPARKHSASMNLRKVISSSKAIIKHVQYNYDVITFDCNENLVESIKILSNKFRQVAFIYELTEVVKKDHKGKHHIEFIKHHYHIKQGIIVKEFKKSVTKQAYLIGIEPIYDHLNIDEHDQALVTGKKTAEIHNKSYQDIQYFMDGIRRSFYNSWTHR